MTIKQFKEYAKPWPDDTELLCYDGLDPTDVCIVKAVIPTVDRLTNKVYLRFYGEDIAPMTDDLQ